MTRCAPKISTWVGVMLLVIASWSCSGPATPPLAVGHEAPHFDLPAIDGGSWSSRQLLGQPSIVVFWATWCLPCHEEIPLLNSIASSGAARVVSISLDEKGTQAVAPFLLEHPLEYPVLLGDEKVFRRWDGLTIPYTLILDADFVVVGKFRGRLDPAEAWDLVGGRPE